MFANQRNTNLRNYRERCGVGNVLGQGWRCWEGREAAEGRENGKVSRELKKFLVGDIYELPVSAGDRKTFGLV